MPTYTDRINGYAFNQFRTSIFLFKTALPIGEGGAEPRPTTGQLYPRGR